MKNKIIFLALFISHLCISQSISLNQGNTEVRDYFSEVPYEYVNGKIIIPVKIENKIYRFLLDTGAPNCITKNLDSIIKPKILQNIEVTDANNNKSKMNVVQIPTLEIGGIIFQNSVALTSNDSANLIFDCFQIDGFIGSNLLRNSILQIDTKSKVIRITNDLNKLNLNKKNGIKVSLFGKQSSPFIWLKLKGVKSAKEQVLLDTGMKGFYDISNENYDILKKEKIIKLVNTGTGSKGISMFGNANHKEQLRLMLPEITISSSTFLNVNTITTDDRNSRIGITLFEHGIGTLDYKKKRFYFDPFTTLPIDMKENLLGFSPTILDNKLSVGIVWDEKLKDKMQTGDEITEINNKNFQDYNICDLIVKESIFNGIDIFEITIKTKDGEIKKINL